MKSYFYLRALILCYLFGLPFLSFTQNPSISVTTTNCSTWNCTPCDGTFTLTLNNPTGPGPYTFWLMDTTTWTVVDSITTTSTTHTFTGLCPGYYYTDIAWQSTGGNPCSNCTGGTACPTCPPTGGGGGGGGGGAIGAPNPNLVVSINCSPPDPCGFPGGGIAIDIIGDAPPFVVSGVVNSQWGGGPFTINTNGSTFISFGCDEGIGSINVMDASGQVVTVDATYCGSACGFNAIMTTIPDIEVCAGETIGPVYFYNHMLQNSGSIVTSDHLWLNDNVATGIPANGQGSVFQFTAPMVTSTEVSNITVNPYEPFFNNICYGQSTTFQIIVHPLPNVNAGVNQTICEGDSIQLSGTGDGNLTWSNGIPNNGYYAPGLGTEQLTLTATTAQGCIDSSIFQIITNPLPIISTSPDTTLCFGDSVQLIATGVGSISWSTGTTNGDWYAPLTSGMAIATLTDGNGCSKSDTVQITVHALPNIDAGPQQIICSGDSVVLNGSGGNSYLWNNGVVNGTVFYPVSTDWYTVIGTDTSGCANQDSVEIIVNALPVIDAGTDTSICMNETMVLTGSGGAIYVWNNGVLDGIPFTVSSSQTYTVIGTDNNGCLAADSITITMYSLPIVDAGQDMIICNGDSVQLLGSGAISYNWNNGVQNGDYVLPSAGNTYIVEGTDANGCTDVDSVTISISSPPSINAGANIYGCEGDSIVLNAIGSNGVISWNGNPNPQTIQITGDSIYYFATITDAGGCTAVDSVLVFGDSLPTAAFYALPAEGCAPLTVTFVNTSSGAMNDCSWDFGNGVTVAGCGNQSTTYLESGYYNVSLSIATLGGCSNSVTLANAIFVEPNPIASFIVTPEIVSELDGHVQTTNLSSGASTYEWDFGDNSGLQFGINEDHTYPTEISQGYIIELVAFSPLLCTDTAWASILVEEEVIFYVPNTFSPDGDAHNNSFYPVITSGIDIYDFEFIIFNRWGQQIFISQNPEIGWDGTFAGRMSQDGTYNWRMEFKLKNGDERQVHYGHVNLLK